jgi:hypothetical protein
VVAKPVAKPVAVPTIALSIAEEEEKIRERGIAGKKLSDASKEMEDSDFAMALQLSETIDGEDVDPSRVPDEFSPTAFLGSFLGGGMQGAFGATPKPAPGQKHSAAGKKSSSSSSSSSSLSSSSTDSCAGNACVLYTTYDARFGSVHYRLRCIPKRSFQLWFNCWLFV